MTQAYIFAVIGLLSFAAMGIIAKLGHQLKANPLSIALYAVIFAGIFSAIRAA